MAEAVLLNCAGSAIPQCIPQELTNKITRPVSYVLFYRSNVAYIPTKIEQLKEVKVEVEARSLVAETNRELIMHAYEIHEWLSATSKIIQNFEDSTKNKKNCFLGS